MKIEHTDLCCRHCNSSLKHVFVDLQTCPPSNLMVKQNDLNKSELYFPLKIYVCQQCFLVQVDEVEKATAIFNDDYTYFSSFSSSWVEHARLYVEEIIPRLKLGSESQVIEIASNDGYLLQHFIKNGIPVLGVEPTANTAEVAISKDIPTIIDFFGRDFAENKLVANGIKADLILGNNVLAHVPDINDFVKGIKMVLKPGGVVTMEFPHLVRLIEESQFDTIYHEHFSYLSFTTVSTIFSTYGLEMFDVQQIPTHGGSLRIFAKHSENVNIPVLDSVNKLLSEEALLGICNLEYYDNFQYKTDNIKYDFIEFLLKAKREGKKVIGYGAAAKGNTLINYCGIKGEDLISFVVDSSPYKQGRYLPGSRIPVYNKDEILKFRPDFIIILPWNLKEEIMSSLSYIREWNGKFVIAIPRLKII